MMDERGGAVNAHPLRVAAPRAKGLRSKLWQAVQAGLDGSIAPLPDRQLRPLIAEYTATFGSTWRPATRRKHQADFARFMTWLEAHGRPTTTASLDFPTLVDYVEDLRVRPKVSGVWRGDRMPSGGLCGRGLPGRSPRIA